MFSDTGGGILAAAFLNASKLQQMAKTAKQKAVQAKFKKSIAKAKIIYKKGGSWKAAVKKAFA